MAPSSSSKPLELPVVSFSLLAQDQHDPPHVDNSQFVQFGYNDDKEWAGYHECSADAQQGRGGRYMRWIQPLESELAKQVEYDMDEQDKVWLDTFNAERKKEAIAPIAYEVFEVIMDKLEKEWFDLTKSIPKKSNAIPSENEKCAICDDGECENSNAIVFCDGCNLAVHQDCYGVPYIPEGQWLCRKCTVSPDKPVDCVFCPQPFGAFKQTTTGHWGHLLCAIWIPETGVSNTVYMEPIDGVENVPKSRWKLNCYLCKKKFGACIQCSNRNCYTAYHVTCAREFGLEVRMKQPGSTSNSSGGELKSWCDKHGKVQWDLFSQSRAATPSSTRIPAISHHPTQLLQYQQQQQHNLSLSGSASLPSLPTSSTTFAQFALPSGGVPSAGSAPMNPNFASTSASTLPRSPAPIVPLASSKSLRSKKTHLSPIKQTPLIPNFIFDRIVTYVSRVKGLTGKKDVVSSVCRYWSLKREGRTGAPLLKRIHLEPWTASATSRMQSDSDRASKLELIKLLRTDLERVRMLTEQVRKREKKKLERLRWVKEAILDEFVWPKETRLRSALSDIISWDKQQYFLNAVDPVLVPDYHDIIKSPMHWSAMSAKIDRHEYQTAQSFADDANLVMANAQLYNKPSSPIHKHALKILERLEPLLPSLRRELDDPLGELSVRMQLAPRLLLDEFDFKPDDVDDEPRPGQEEPHEDKVVAIEELENVWYNVEDPLGDRKEKAEQAERDRVRAEEEAETERRRIEREEQEQAKRAEEEQKRERERLAKEQEKLKAKEKGKEKAKEQSKPRIKDKENEDVEMAPPSSAVKGKKRKAENDGTGDGDPKSKSKKKKSSKQTRPDEPQLKDPEQKKMAESATSAAAAVAKDSEQNNGAETAISNRDTFTMFETGWVLPEGSSRRKPATPNTSHAPLPSTNAESRPPPVASTSASSNSAGPVSAQPTKATSPSKETPSKGASPRKGKDKAPPEAARDIDEEKPLATISTNGNGGLSIQVVGEWKRRFADVGAKVAVKEKTDLSDGTLVWHRLAGMTPFYPGEIADEKGSDMPPELLATKPKGRSGAASVERWPLLYFDEKRSGAWGMRSEMRLLGEDKEFDQLMMEPAAVRAYCKNKTSKQCKEYAVKLAEAYEFALKNVEIDEPEDAGTGMSKKEKKGKKRSKPSSKRKSAAAGGAK